MNIPKCILLLFFLFIKLTHPAVKNIALIGLGPHAKRIYYPFLEKISNKKNINIKLIATLDDQEETAKEYLKYKKLQPENIIFLDKKENISPKKIDQRISSFFSKNEISHAIISTEPKAHKAYLAECIRYKIPVLVDKPITAFEQLDLEGVSKIEKDILELLNLIKKNNGSRVLVQCQRRNHKGYLYVFNLIREILTKYNIPINYINIHHSDGMWNMPSEYNSRENHPYKYGYGKLCHSGYHFIDLFYQLIKLNLTIKEKKPDSISIFNQSTFPEDHIKLFNKSNYNYFFKDYKFSFKKNKNYGELDHYSQFQLLKNNKIMTSAQISLLQSSFSQRAWTYLPPDTYKGNGRIRHEAITINIGPLYNIQIHSYQSTEINSRIYQNDSYGGKEHFDIYIYKNSNLLGGSPFEHIKLKDITNQDEILLGHNEESRYQVIEDLLENQISNSELDSHITPTILLATLYKNQIKQKNSKIPYSKHSLKDIFYE